MKTETMRVGPEKARDVFVKVKDLVMDGWKVYGQAGYCRQGCADVDVVEIYLVREKAPKPGAYVMPSHLADLEGREG